MSIKKITEKHKTIMLNDIVIKTKEELDKQLISQSVENYDKIDIKSAKYQIDEELRKYKHERALEKAITEIEEDCAIDDLKYIEKHFQVISVDHKLYKLATKFKKAYKKAYANVIPTRRTALIIFCYEFLKDKFNFFTPKPLKRGEKVPLYFYDNSKGIYVSDNNFLKRCISYVTGASLDEKGAETVIYHFQNKTTPTHENTEYKAFGNCLLNTKTLQIKAFTPEIKLTKTVCVDYNPFVIEPEFIDWKPSKLFSDISGGDKEQEEYFYQLVRRVLLGYTNNTLDWFVGEGGTGKGTIQALITNLVGTDNVASIKINEIAKDKFIMADALGKSVVIGDDIQAGIKIDDTSAIFSLVTGDPIRIREMHKQGYTVKLELNVIQSTNELPQIIADNDAVSRRFTMLYFPPIKGKRNPNIKYQYLKNSEVLEWFAYESINRQRKDITPKNSIKLVDEYLETINPVKAFAKFLDEWADETENTFLPNNFTWLLFKDWLNHENQSYYRTSVAFHKELKKYLKRWKPTRGNTPKGFEHPQGFYKDDLPLFAKHGYSVIKESERPRGYSKNIKNCHTCHT